ncbi:hypothetical protein TTHERM_00095600 (macronuclear) [Tetrahymena thermophila SB210]|uniref:Transmembrane protein n=1 Tax=Tetrahymena thermophila (strain SB210) TaxID=312017 RepID=Q234Y9_TETTS|nr:hypothetical protein TTHERM_00095600 [Tetrahymena thermophila SB210]EAR91864.1 hypothetical protein TTHERM_00095600 [Tetrahymena thermophila SB210]|eukprot:XP_001012109.1 hypothetical protein TTHERM_00095600 [Tetrahymena thermophila SB210]
MNIFFFLSLNYFLYIELSAQYMKGAQYMPAQCRQIILYMNKLNQLKQQPFKESKQLRKKCLKKTNFMEGVEKETPTYKKQLIHA